MQVIPLSIFISLLWGINPIIMKLLLKELPLPFIMIANTVIYIVCLTLYGAFYYNDVVNGFNQINARLIFLLVINVVFMLFVSNVIYLYLLKEHTSSIVSALVCTSPFFTAIIGYLLLKEKLDWRLILGIVMIVLGTIVIAWSYNI